MTSRDVGPRLLEQLTKQIGTLLGARASVQDTTLGTEGGFIVSFTAEGCQGDLRIFFARAGAVALVDALGGAASASTDAIVTDRLRTIAGQAAAAVTGVTLAVASIEAAAVPPDATAAAAAIVVAGHGRALEVAVSGDLEPAITPTPQARTRALDVILDIDLPLVVRFGRTELPLRTLAGLGPGSVIDLARSPEEPVDVLISNRVVARGEVVVVGGNYGVRVREVISPAERARAMEGDLA